MVQPCVDCCPGQAIYRKTKILEDGYPQFIDREKCAPAFSKNCSQCISSYLFIWGNYYGIKESYLEHKEKRKKSIDLIIEAVNPNQR